MLQHVAVCFEKALVRLRRKASHVSNSEPVDPLVCCSVLQCAAAVCCSVLQRVAVFCKKALVRPGRKASHVSDSARVPMNARCMNARSCATYDKHMSHIAHMNARCAIHMCDLAQRAFICATVGTNSIQIWSLTGGSDRYRIRQVVIIWIRSI